MSKGNSIKKMLCLLLCLAMAVSMLTGCGKKEEEKPVGTQSEQAGEEQSSTQSETAYFPRPETEEISVWTEWSSPICDSPDDVRSVQEMEKLTNVHINWTFCSQSESQEKFGLMLASGEYPDIIFGSYYPGGIIAAHEDGVYIDATDLVEKYMPNYKAIVTLNPEWDKMTKTDDGKRVAIYQANCYNDVIEGENPWIGSVIRKDWLDELGLEVPETLEDWHTALTAMKEVYGATMDLNASGQNFNHDFISAFGILGGFYQKDGKVYYGPMQDEYFEYLKMMQQWYKEGLINPNFSTYSEWTDPFVNFGMNQASAGPIIGSYAYTYLKDTGMATDENFFLQTVQPPVMNAGDKPQTGMAITEFSRYCAISSACENTELVARYLDQYYTKEIMELSSYGVEGESYTKNENEEYVFTDIVLNDPDGISPGDAISKHTLKAAVFAGYYNWGYAPALYGMWLDEAQGIWKVSTDLCLPSNMTMTADETVAYSTIYTDIQTMMTEYTSRYIMGIETEESFESFRQKLVEYGIEECLRYQQAALDRYNAR